MCRQAHASPVRPQQGSPQVWATACQQACPAMTWSAWAPCAQHRSCCHASGLGPRPAAHEKPVRRAQELQQDPRHRECRLLRQGQPATSSHLWQPQAASTALAQGSPCMLSKHACAQSFLSCCSATASFAMLRQACARSGAQVRLQSHFYLEPAAAEDLSCRPPGCCAQQRRADRHPPGHGYLTAY